MALQRIERSPTFLRQAKSLGRKHYDLDKLERVVRVLVNEDKETLRRRYHDHALKGNLSVFRELHIESDWLLIYRVKHETLTLLLVETGSHRQLLGK
ncbi:type II toxin-antitoxin system YafQ family toxin [Bifidobacterium sp. ESL0764]|uniref:type II toxin-antitoxin system RelE/ParE family toxin n=1 Tax=Bifidobacterium sp. ESL0764 TaxID=2983228 RepID=UPI0023F91FDB|nr:type II toxin-antitoxin system YafQ family toxin [Bifidobacterium sp. ESL0764]WEV65103.1 type II toxin-antitoxin system YafQ family toxin [Bifidobacterium sp. ESL0764]